MDAIKRLKADRKELGCSQFELAKLAGLSRYRLSLLECGYCQPTNAEVTKIRTELLKIAEEDAKHFFGLT